MAKVKVYSTPTCPWCHKAKEYFEEKGVEFEDIDVSSDQKAADEMIEKSGQMGVPVIEIDGQIIIGFDQAAINKALGKGQEKKPKKEVKRK
jgi:glutaredoxin-like YruB-family protein